MIQEETVSDRRADDVSLTAGAAEKFKEAISDFNRVNNKRWILQRRFQIERSLTRL